MKEVEEEEVKEEEVQEEEVEEQEEKVDEEDEKQPHTHSIRNSKKEIGNAKERS